MEQQVDLENSVSSSKQQWEQVKMQICIHTIQYVCSLSWHPDTRSPVSFYLSLNASKSIAPKVFTRKWHSTSKSQTDFQTDIIMHHLIWADSKSVQPIDMPPSFFKTTLITVPTNPNLKIIQSQWAESPMCESHVWIGWKPAEFSQLIRKNKVLLSAPLVLQCCRVTVCQSEVETSETYRAGETFCVTDLRKAFGISFNFIFLCINTHGCI